MCARTGKTSTASPGPHAGVLRCHVVIASEWSERGNLMDTGYLGLPRPYGFDTPFGLLNQRARNDIIYR
jgi:hypothetical protein